MSLLTIVQRAARRLSLPVPSSVVNSTDKTTPQLLEFANQTGEELMREYAWEVLQKEASFTTVATESQGALSTIASDYDRLLNDTMYNRSQQWKVPGSRTAQDWQQEKGLIAATIRDTFRIRGGEILFSPVPSAGDTVYFEYVSKNWAESSGGTGKAEFTADDDVSLLDEELIRRGIVWRFKQDKGFSFAEEKADYDRLLNQRKAADKGGERVRYLGSSRPRSRVPEGNWTL